MFDPDSGSDKSHKEIVWMNERGQVLLASQYSISTYQTLGGIELNHIEKLC
jgi:hypothetical protein